MRIQLSLSRIKLSKARPYMRLFDRNRYSNIFNKYGTGKGRDKYRIYIPVGERASAEPNMKVPQPILNFLMDRGMTIDSYLAGTVFMPDGKRVMKLGKLLANNKTLKQLFDNDPQRVQSKAVQQWVVISRHPYDIIGMSFDRGWSSCMNLEDGENRHYLEKDVKYGTLVAYLINNTDKNINAPVARIAIRPYVRRVADQHKLLVQSQVYGTASSLFSKTVKLFCDWANSGSPTGVYTLANGLYHDYIDDEDDDSNSQKTVFYFNPGDKLSDLTEDVKVRLLQSQVCTNDLFEKLSKDKSFIVRATVAQQCQSDHILQTMIKDRSPEVRVYLVKNSALSESSLTKLLQVEKNDHVLTALARLRSERTLELLADAKYLTPAIASLIIRNVHVSSGIIDKLVRRTTEHSVWLDAAKRSKTLDATLIYIAENAKDDEDIITEIIHNDHCPKELFAAQLNSQSIEIQRAIAVCTTDISILKALSKTRELKVIEAIMANPIVTSQIVASFLPDATEAVAERAIRTRKLSDQSLHMLAKSKSSLVRAAVARTPHLSRVTVELLAKDKNADVLIALIRMQSVPESMQQVIAKHRDPTVLYTLAGYTTSAPVLESLKGKNGVKYDAVRARALRQLSKYGDSPMRQKNLIDEEEDDDDYDDTW